MRGKTETLDILSCVVKEARRLGLDAEAIWSSYREATMRSAWGEVHQTPTADAGILEFRLRRGLRAARISVAESNQKAIRAAVKRCSEMLSEVPENPYLPDLLHPPTDFPEETGNLQGVPEFPDDLAVKERAFAHVRHSSRGTQFVGSGRFFTAGCEMGVANTAGLARYHTASYSFLSLVVTGAHGLSSYADRASTSPEGVDVDAVIDEAFTRAARAQQLPFFDPFSDGKGARRYDSVFTHYAVGEWLYWLSMFIFNGLSVFEGESFLSGYRMGDRITGDRFSMRDDWTHPGVIPLPFDLEGATRSVLPLVERGIFRGIPCDGMTAKKSGMESTGHSLFGSWGAVPFCVVVDGGNDTFETLVAQSVTPTIVGTYFNYPSLPDLREAVFTATTRHGTFLVEDGKYKAVCPPLRLRMRSFEALERIDGMTPPRLIRGQENYGMFYPISLVVPAMRLKNINFVGSNPTI